MVRGKRCWKGGAQLVFPAPVENSTYESSFSSPSKMMLSQGEEYQSLHAGQHGGAVAINPSPAPPGYTGMLDSNLRGQAWLNPIDESLKSIQGMSDQSGGRRRRRRGTSKRGRGASKRRRGASKRGRRMRGGAALSLANAQDFRAPGMLLSPGQEAAALGGMNPEWKLATDPNSFAPNLSE
jgi:hypothetical protein